MVSYDVREVSNHGGQRIKLYQFTLGGLNFYYTNAERDLTYQGKKYTAAAMSSGSVKQSGDPSQDDFTLSIPDDLMPAPLYKGTGPSMIVMVTIRTMHYGTPDAPVQFIGELTDHNQPEIGRMEFTAQYLTAALERTGLRLTFNRSCPHALYDEGCKINKNDFAIPAVLTYVDGANIQAAEFAAKPDGWFDGGFFEWSIGPDTVNSRSVEAQVGNNFRVFGFTDGLEVGMTVTAYPGCARIIQVCFDKFNNVTNYGGFPALPGKSPFDGTPVF